jgi:hypothetical protein
VVSSNNRLEDGRAIGELALVTADPLKGRRIGALERAHDLLDAKGVIAEERFGSAHVAKLVEHGVAALVRALVGFDGLELDL